MLSKDNIKKLNFNGLYSHKPELKYRNSIHSGDLYWCFNWIFKVRKNETANGKTYYSMIDTYYGDIGIEVTDDNIDEFTLLFDFDDVKEISKNSVYDYNDEDLFHVAIGSGGWEYSSKYFIKKETQKSKDIMLERLDGKIAYYESMVKSTKEDKKRVLNSEDGWEYINTSY